MRRSFPVVYWLFIGQVAPDATSLVESLSAARRQNAQDLAGAVGPSLAATSDSDPASFVSQQRQRQAPPWLKVN